MFQGAIQTADTSTAELARTENIDSIASRESGDKWKAVLLPSRRDLKLSFLSTFPTFLDLAVLEASSPCTLGSSDCSAEEDIDYFQHRLGHIFKVFQLSRTFVASL